MKLWDWDDPGGRMPLAELRRRQLERTTAATIAARKATMICAYCFGEIRGEPHTVRGRPYHPPVMTGRQGVAGTGCAAKDAAATPKPEKVHRGQLSIEDGAR